MDSGQAMSLCQKMKVHDKRITIASTDDCEAKICPCQRSHIDSHSIASDYNYSSNLKAGGPCHAMKKIRNIWIR